MDVIYPVVIVGVVAAVVAALRLERLLLRVLAVQAVQPARYGADLLRSSPVYAWDEALAASVAPAPATLYAPPARPRAEVLRDLHAYESAAAPAAAPTEAETARAAEIERVCTIPAPTFVVPVPVVVAAATAPAPPLPPADELPVYFKRGEPTRFTEIGSQHQIVDYLSNAVHGLHEHEQAIDPVILLGPPGLGKTTIAKVTANELRLRALDLELPEPEFIEVFPADVPNVQALDAVMRRVQRNPGSVLFIDEVHDVEGDKHWHKLYMFLQENRYKFEGEPNPVVMPPTTVLAATTDSGKLHGALMRRFVRRNMVRATAEEIKVMVKRRPFPISEPAVDLLVDRCGSAGAPWEVLEAYEEAIVYAKGTKRDGVTTTEVRRVFENQGIDQHGLRTIDRQVLSVLFQLPRTRKRREGGDEFVCYGQSESTVTTLAQVDREYYIESVRPRLMSRGLLEIRSTYGQAITTRGEALYGHLIPHAPAGAPA